MILHDCVRLQGGHESKSQACNILTHASRCCCSRERDSAWDEVADKVALIKHGLEIGTIVFTFDVSRSDRKQVTLCHREK